MQTHWYDSLFSVWRILPVAQAGVAAAALLLNFKAARKHYMTRVAYTKTHRYS